MANTVGIIANPAAGKDIRRLAAHGRTVGTYEKVGMVRRVLLALDAVGVERVLLMPDRSQIAARALEGLTLGLHADVIAMSVVGDERDSTCAAGAMVEAAVACIVTLGGDGTNRAVARASGNVPLVPISTGTNNVFPMMVEPTAAGLAAGQFASGDLDAGRVCRALKRLDVYVDGVLEDIALIDVAISRERSIGARAIWDVAAVRELVLTCAEPTAIGLSAIGAQLEPLDRAQPRALHVRLDPGSATSVLAAVAPGIVQRVNVGEWRLLRSEERVRVAPGGGTVALDGERQLVIADGATVEVLVNPHGPRVLDVEEALREATSRAALVRAGGST